MLLKAITRFFYEYKEPRYRDRRNAFYPSELMKDARDIYWGMTKEPVTNPTDLQGHMRMGMGKAVEEWLVKHVLSNLHFFGIHRMSSGSQVAVGGSEPVPVNGYLDDLLVAREGDKFGEKYALEIKVLNGFGGDKVLANEEFKQEHLAQLGYYLYHLNNIEVTNKGILLCVIDSDKNKGNMIEFSCRYDAATDEAICYQRKELFSGKEQPCNHRVKIKPLLARLNELLGYVEKRSLPPADKQYKYPVTEELAASLTDWLLQRVKNGHRVIGDWQVLYSSWADLHKQLQGGAGYTDEELAVFKKEFATRAPRRAAKRKKA